MSVFFTQDIFVFIVIGFAILLVVVFIIRKRPRSSEVFEPVDESKQPEQIQTLKLTDKTEQVQKEDLADRNELARLSPVLSTVYAPELNIGTEERPRFQKVRYFFTYQERIFFEFLSKSVGDVYQVFAKVRMADVLYLANEPMEKKRYNGHIRCRHFDYLLCGRSQQTPIIVIELDDSSHQKYQRYDRKASDDFKNLACKTAQLPLLRVKLPNRYSHEELANLIQTTIKNTRNER